MSCTIVKERYRGPWLRGADAAPADPHFLRNYMVRKTLELAFGESRYGSDASLELVLDRVDYSDEQVLNLRRYLNGEFTEYGPFRFPRITHVTHGDSVYIDGLQVADHFARLSYAIARGSARDEALALARRHMTMATIVAGRPFTLLPGARGALARRTRREGSA